MLEDRSVSVCILATSDTLASTLFGLIDILSAVGVGWETYVTNEDINPAFDVKIVSVDGLPIKCCGTLVTPDCSINEARETDIAIVASFTNAQVTNREHDNREFEWLHFLQRSGSTIGAVCSGVSLLAASGMLNNIKATTHWAFKDSFAEAYPEVDWYINQTLCCSGENNQIITSGGTTSWQELALHLILRYCGVESANQAAKFWVIPDRGESQTPYSVSSIRKQHEDAIIKDCQDWISERYEQANPITAMLDHTGLTQATFARRFKKATGVRPIDYIHNLKIERAKHLLETTLDNIDDIGRNIGYEDAASFRRIFKRFVFIPPSAYRRKFGYNRFDRMETS